MPCNSVAVVRAKLEPNIGAEVVGKADVTEALRKFLEAASGPTTMSYSDDYGVQFVVGQFTVYLAKNGVLQIYGGRPNDQRPVQALKAKLEAFLPMLAVASANKRLATSLRSKYRVVEDVPAPKGARMLTIEF